MLDLPFKADIQGVVLAGGKASRFGELEGLLPKCLLPVSATHTLLSCLLDQLAEAGFDNIVVSTSGVSFPLIKSFVDRYSAWQHVRRSAGPAGLVVINNPQHQRGPLHALAEVLGRFPAPRYLICLGDIFFGRNPFLHINHSVDGRSDENCLLIWSHPSGERLAMGGTVCTEGRLIKSLSYHGTKHAKDSNLALSSWSGSALFGVSVKEDLSSFVSFSSSEVLEDFFNYSISKGRHYTGIEVGEFINVNLFRDLQRLLAVTDKGAAINAVTAAEVLLQRG